MATKKRAHPIPHPEEKRAWFAQITKPDTEGVDLTNDGDMLDMVSATSREDADRIAASLGCTIEWEEDAENGCWAVWIGNENEKKMHEDSGWLHLTNEQGSILIDAGDTKEEEE